MKKKRKGKSETIIDGIDLEILKVLSKHKKLTITKLRMKIGLTHANLTTHMKRLDYFVVRERDKQTIYVSLNEGGINLVRLLKKYTPKISKMYVKEISREIKKSLKK